MREGLTKEKPAGPVEGRLVFRAAEYLGAAVFGLFVLERCNLGGTAEMYRWLSARPALALAETAALAAAYGLLRAFFRRPVLPFALYGGLVCLIGTANYYKLFYRSEPLTPFDIFNVGPALSIAGTMRLSLDKGLVFNAVLLLLCLLTLGLGQKRYAKAAPPRRLRGMAAAFCLPALCLGYLGDLSHLRTLGVRDIRYDQYDLYRENGFTLSTLMNLSGGGVEAPENYGEAATAVLAAGIEAAETPEALGSPPGMPHIIVLQMEAFGDPADIDPRISYAKDPFGPLTRYAGEIRRFHTLVSALGGGTANTEYEVLSGYNMYFCPPGVTPFIRYVNKERPSLAAELRALGYRTVAMHPHDGGFYSRNTAYPRLGFQRFVTGEDFTDPEYAGNFISDAEFGRKAVELFAEESAEGPVFLFGVSIQNHGPYSIPELYRPFPVRQKDGLALSEAQIRELETFGANLYDGASMLAWLIGELKKVEEPVLLLVYGDHQAAWSWALDMPGTPDVELTRYGTESFFWANYPLDAQTRPLVSASGLAPLLLRRAGLPLSLYMKGIDLQFAELLAYNVAVTVENDGSADYARGERLEAYRLLQYDRMFGELYLERR